MLSFIFENYNIKLSIEDDHIRFISNRLLMRIKINLVDAISANLFGFHKQVFRNALYPKSLDGYRTIIDFRSTTYKERINISLNDTEDFVSSCEYFINKLIRDVVKFYQ